MSICDAFAMIDERSPILVVCWILDPTSPFLCISTSAMPMDCSRKRYFTKCETRTSAYAFQISFYTFSLPSALACQLIYMIKRYNQRFLHIAICWTTQLIYSDDSIIQMYLLVSASSWETKRLSDEWIHGKADSGESLVSQNLYSTEYSHNTGMYNV